MKTLAITLAFLAACGSGLNLKPSPVPTSDQLKQDFAPKDAIIFSADGTFRPNPEGWLGRVGLVRKEAGSCTNGKISWHVDYVRNSDRQAGDHPGLGYPVDVKSTEPEIQAQYLITQTTAADIAALSFVSAKLDANSAAEVVLTAYATQRIKASERFEIAYANYVETHPMGDDVCFAFVVTGYSHKTLMTKRHMKVDSKAAGGMSGVNISGTYMASTEGYKLDHIFELSPAVIKDASRVDASARSVSAPSSQQLLELQRALNVTPIQ